MPEPMPPLNAVRAFEAAARHLSFTRAAEELYVTHGAVSRQVKNLEEFLDKKLFQRLPGRLDLTPAGRVYAELVREVLEQLAHGTAEMMRDAGREKLTVSVIPSFASRWLVPRLERFYEAYPDWEILINVTLDLVDLERDGIDLAVRLGRGRWPGLSQDYLFSADLAPVCAPDLISAEKPLSTPNDLSHHRLLHTDAREQWTTWLRLAKAEGVDVMRGPVYSDVNVTIQAAIEGQGVALANLQLIQNELDAGKLTAPFPLSLTEDVGYYLVYPRGTGEHEKIKAMRDWLRQETQEAERARNR